MTSSIACAMLSLMTKKQKKQTAIAKRGAIFVSPETHERFKSMADADDRKFDAFLNRLMNFAKANDLK